MRRLALALCLAAAVTGAIYAAGRAITPNYGFGLFGRRALDAISLKAQLATAVLALAVLQLLLAGWMYGKLPGADAVPRQVPLAHRIVGFTAFALTVPIAVHCLFAYGVQLTSARVAIHSIAGCFFYGAFAAKVLIVRSRRLPGWALPVAGGTLIVVIVVLWYTAALWYYNGFRLPGA
jgi:hypothetical protein